MTATLTANKIPQQAAQMGPLKVRVASLALATNDYLTGGIAVTPNSVGLAEIYGVIVIGQDATNVGYLPVWDITNGKLQLFRDATPAAASPLVEVTNATSTAVTLRLLVIGV